MGIVNRGDHACHIGSEREVHQIAGAEAEMPTRETSVVHGQLRCVGSYGPSQPNHSPRVSVPCDPAGHAILARRAAILSGGQRKEDRRKVGSPFGGHPSVCMV